MKKAFIIAIISLTPTRAIHAQETRVLVRTAEERNLVQVKYYSSLVYFEDGANIYRRQQGRNDWVKLNATPLRKGEVRPGREQLNHDQELSVLVNMLDSAVQRDIKGFVLLSVLLKSFQSEAFSRYLGILYDDATTQPGTTYEYKVMRILGNRETEAGSSPVITAGNHKATTPPIDIVVTSRDYKTSFSWKPETDRYFGINVYRQTKGTAGERLLTKRPVMLSKVADEKGIKGYPKIMFEDDSLAAGTYNYELSAVDFFGEESRRSTAITVEVKDTTPPPAPEKVVSEVDNVRRQVTLSWRKVTAPDLAGYVIHRATKSTGEFVRVNKQIIGTDKIQYADQLERPKSQYYTVSSIDKAGNEAKSAITFAPLKDVVPPGSPINVLVRSDTGKIVISWSKNMEPDLRGYQVYRTVNTNKQEKFSLVNATPFMANSFEEKLPRHVKNKFLYKVVAVDSSYNKSEFSVVVGMKLPDVTAPPKLFIKQVSSTDKSLVIEWMPAMDKDLKQIKLFRSSEGQNIAAVATLDPNAVRYEDMQIEANRNYKYSLTVLDSAGNESEKSNEFTASLVKNASAAKVEGVVLKYDSIAKSVTVNWSMLTTANNYIVYRKEPGEEFRPVCAMIKERSFTDKGMAVGKIYDYRVKAFDEKGVAGESENYSVEIK